MCSLEYTFILLGLKNLRRSGRLEMCSEKGAAKAGNSTSFLFTVQVVEGGEYNYYMHTLL
jgi:hypothetical protein